MKAAYLKLHPRSEEKWDAIGEAEDDERAEKIRELFEATRKGDFAQELASQIEELDNQADGATSKLSFTPPDYLVRAIEAACQ